MLERERDIVARLRSGDRSALTELYDESAGPVYRTARLLSRSPTAADLITVEVYVAVWRDPDALVGHRGGLSEYLVRSAGRRAVAWRARHRPPTDRPLGFLNS